VEVPAERVRGPTPGREPKPRGKISPNSSLNRSSLGKLLVPSRDVGAAIEAFLVEHQFELPLGILAIANHANFRLPNINIGVPAGGAITNTLTGFGRQLQLVAKIVF
jgi:hypothetical protein